MPGKQVRSWKQYHKLRSLGFTKKSAAKITNASGKKGKGGKRGKKGK